MSLTKVGITSLGCPRNLVDSESILGRLARKKYKIVDIKEADIGIVNTCSFIDEAKKESVDAILDLIDLKKRGILKKVIVAGCLAERYVGELLPNLKEVDAFIGRVNLNHSKSYDRYPLTLKHTSYVKISEGCNHLCSFCAIPKIKGRLKSRNIDSILKEIRLLDSQRKSEINIIGQDVSLYGLDIYKELRLAYLLKAIARVVKHISWIRLMYLHPRYLSGELISIVAEESRICKYIDLPLQHISDRILKAMNRKTTRKDICRLLDTLRKRIPGVCIRTSLIVGFPQETKKEFQELVSFVKEQKFERLGVFKYSREEGTRAYNYSGQKDEKTKDERFNIIMRLQREISEEFNRGLRGKDLEVLIDEKDSNGVYVGRLSIDAPEIDGSVYVHTNKILKPGEFRRVRIIDSYEYDLVGQL